MSAAIRVTAWNVFVVLAMLAAISCTEGIIRAKPPGPELIPHVEPDLDMRKFELQFLYALLKNDHFGVLSMLRLGVEPSCNGFNTAEAAEIGLDTNLIGLPPMILFKNLHGPELGKDIFETFASLGDKDLPVGIIPTQLAPQFAKPNFPEDLAVVIDPFFCEQFLDMCRREFEDGYPVVPQFLEQAFMFKHDPHTQLLLEFASAETFTNTTLSGRTLVQEAIRRGDTVMLQALLAHKFMDVNVLVGPNNLTALHFAVYDGKVNKSEIIDQLLDAGADPNVGDRYGRTPLMHAVIANDVPTVKQILTHSDILGTRNELLQHKDNFGLTVIDMLADCPWLKELRALLDVNGSYRPVEYHGQPANHTLRSGNWVPHQPNALDSEPKSPPTLPIDSIDAHDLSISAFITIFFARRRPVVLKHAIDAWPAWDWWIPETLLSMYGDTVVTIGQSPDSTNFDPEKGDAVQTRFKRYLDYMLTARDTTADDDSSPTHTGAQGYNADPPFIMDSHDLLANNSGFHYDYYPPPFFRICTRMSMPRVSLGAAASGSKFRPYGHTYMTVVYGQRRVFLRPGDAREQYWDLLNKYSASGLLLDLLGNKKWAHWPSPREDMIEVTMTAGDTLYIPAGWSAAYLNTAETVGLTQQFCEWGEAGSLGDSLYGAAPLQLRRLIHQQQRSFFDEISMRASPGHGAR